MRRRLLIFFVAVFAGAVVARMIPVRSDRIWIDPVTGSMKSQSCWLFFCMTPTVQQSAIERWIIEHEGAYSPGWRFLSRTSRTIGGKAVGWGCSLAPEIYPLHHGDLNTRLVRGASDSEMAEFVRIMREGTASEKERAVDVACQSILEKRNHPDHVAAGGWGSASSTSTPEPVRDGVEP